VNHNKFLGPERNIRSIADWKSFERLSLEGRFFLCNFDNVCSAVRRSTWEKHPFRPLQFAEDLDWGVRVLQAGNKIAYEPAAAVVHSHERPALYHLRRQYVSGKLVPRILRCPIVTTPAANDRQLFGLINSFVQEAFGLVVLVHQLIGCISADEWRHWVKHLESTGLPYSTKKAQKIKSMNQTLRKWLGFTSHLPSSSNMTEMRNHPMRAHFYFLVREVTQAAPTLNASLLCQVIVHCLARTIGGFLGAYYLWSEHQGQLSPDLEALDRVLSLGV
jgi:hypothetical protein